MDFTDISYEDLDAQLSEMESWLIGCCNALCQCGSGLLDPEKHHMYCPYKVAAESEVDGYVPVDEVELE